MKEKKYKILDLLFSRLNFAEYDNKSINVRRLIGFDYTLEHILTHDLIDKNIEKLLFLIEESFSEGGCHELILKVDKYIKENSENFEEEFINKISEIVNDYKEREEIKKMNLPNYISYHKNKMTFIDDGKEIISGNYSTSIYSIVVLFLDGTLSPSEFNIPLRDIKFLVILNEIFLGKTCWFRS